MTRDKARYVLDAVRDGYPLPEEAITEALRATGDIESQAAAPVHADDVDEEPVVQRVLHSDRWPRLPAGLAPAKWHEVIA
jgi:hypothetical protein